MAADHNSKTIEGVSFPGFNAGLARWFAKHNYYSTREAMEGVQIRKKSRPAIRCFRQIPRARRGG